VCIGHVYHRIHLTDLRNSGKTYNADMENLDGLCWLESSRFL